MRQMMVVAALALATAVPASAQEFFGTFRPALDANFTAGTTDEHNSIGLTAGGHIGLARIGRLRFPVLGVNGGFASRCRADGQSVVQGANDPCGDGMVGLLQVSGGAEFVFGRMMGTGRNYENKVLNEVSLLVMPTYVVAGPFRGNWGVNLGIGYRFGGQ